MSANETHESEALEFRMATFAVVLMVVAAAVVLALWWQIWQIDTISRATRIGASVYAAAGVLVAIGYMVGRLRVDSEGITRKMIFRRFTVRWSQVAFYEIRPMKLFGGRLRHRLKDSSGKLLMDVDLFALTESDRQALYEFLDRKLAGVRKEH